MPNTRHILGIFMHYYIPFSWDNDGWSSTLAPNTYIMFPCMVDTNKHSMWDSGIHKRRFFRNGWFVGLFLLGYDRQSFLACMKKEIRIARIESPAKLQLAYWKYTRNVEVKFCTAPDPIKSKYMYKSHVFVIHWQITVSGIQVLYATTLAHCGVASMLRITANTHTPKQTANILKYHRVSR